MSIFTILVVNVLRSCSQDLGDYKIRGIFFLILTKKKKRKEKEALMS